MHKMGIFEITTNIKIDGMGVDKVDRAKLLGFTISHDLT